MAVGETSVAGSSTLLRAVSATSIMSSVGGRVVRVWSFRAGLTSRRASGLWECFEASRTSSYEKDTITGTSTSRLASSSSSGGRPRNPNTRMDTNTTMSRKAVPQRV